MATLTRVVAFTKVQAAVLNAWADEVERLTGAVFGDLVNTGRPLVAVRRTGTLALTNSTDTVVTWQTFDTDNDGMYDPANPTFVTVRTAGLWLWVSQERFPANGTGLRAGKHMKNGTSVATNSIAAGSQAGVSAGEGNTLQIVGKPQAFIAGDQIYLNAFQSSGGSLSMATDYGGVWLAGVYLGI